jgi:hypothetical protein
VLAIGSLSAGGELNEAHALQALIAAGKINTGADTNFWDKIERAFEAGKQNPRCAPQQLRSLKRGTKRQSTDAKTSKSDAEAHSGDDSRPSRPSCPGVSDQPGGEKQSSSSYEALVKRIAELVLSDEVGARAILADALKGGLSDFQIETLIKRKRSLDRTYRGVVLGR